MNQQQAPVIEQILERARWAPSGDNVQSWQFEIAGPLHVIVHCQDTRHDTVYDLDGHPSQISYGALLETMAIAASTHQLRLRAERRPVNAGEEATLVFDVHFIPAPGLAPDPLEAAIEKRSVQRRAMRTRPLTAAEKSALERSVGEGYTVRWFESFGERWRMARLMFKNARLRLTMPEAYEVHKRIIHWGVERSPDRVPDKALGVDNATLVLMKWAMVSWNRLAKMNALMGTAAPRLQMDLVPGLACAAHYVLDARKEPVTVDDYVAAGRALQRFWLTATTLGLQMQPELTPLIFTRYVRKQIAFTRDAKVKALAIALEAESRELLFGGGAQPVYIGRVGEGPPAPARSERKPLAQLIRR